MEDNIFKKVKKAAKDIQTLSDEERNAILMAIADAIETDMAAAEGGKILKANEKDLAKMDESDPLHDRLKLSPERLKAIAADIRNVCALPSPLGLTLEDRILPNGLRIRKVSAAFGVIGVIYEARPNVTFDVFALCFKSGNACILKGGKDADNSNRAAVAVIRNTLETNGINPDAICLLPATHEAASAMLGAVGYVDLVIPRGGRRLIDFVRNNAKVPCIETGAGVVNTYFDAKGDLEIGKAVICNAKTRRVSVCNALDCMVVHSSRLPDLAELCGPLAPKNVEIIADERAYAALEGKYPAILSHADKSSFGTEFMAYRMAIKTVDSLEEALEHISEFGSGHSESIITEDKSAAEIFQTRVDAACVYVNAPTSFTDGAQFGLGAEIGISTQKLGARGPMGLREITTYKWLIDGHGQTRGSNS